MEQTNDQRANLDQHVGRPFNLQLHVSLRSDARRTLNVVACVNALKPPGVAGDSGRLASTYVRTTQISRCNEFSGIFIRKAGLFGVISLECATQPVCATLGGSLPNPARYHCGGAPSGTDHPPPVGVCSGRLHLGRDLTEKRKERVERK